MLKKFFTSSILLAALLLNMAALPGIIKAATTDVSNNPTTDISNNPTTDVSNSGCRATFCLENPFKIGNNLYDVLKNIVHNVLLPIGGILCVLAFIFAGFKYVTAQGDPKAIDTAHKMLLYASIGTVLLLGAEVFSTAISNTVNSLM